MPKLLRTLLLILLPFTGLAQQSAPFGTVTTAPTWYKSGTGLTSRMAGYNSGYYYPLLTLQDTLSFLATQYYVNHTVGTGYVPLTRLVSTGNGLLGGGNLGSNLTLLADTSHTSTGLLTWNYGQRFATQSSLSAYKLNSDTLYAHGYVPQWQLRNSLTNKQNKITVTNYGSKNSSTIKSDTLNIPFWGINGTNGNYTNLNQNTAFVWLGDSQSTANGIPYQSDASYIVSRSLMTNADGGMPNSRGYLYHTTTNIALELGSGNGITSNGTIVAAGITNSRLGLTAGQTITITKHEIGYADLLYNASNSSGTLSFYLNHNLVRTVALSGTGLQNTFNVTSLLPANRQTSMTDTIVIKASANVEVVGIETFHDAPISPLVFMAAQSGTSFQDYTNTAAINEISFYFNTLRDASIPRFFGIALGTNGIYSSTKALTPAVYIKTLDTLINKVKANVSNLYPLITIPPKAGTAWPVIKTGYVYNDYVTALTKYADSTGYVLIRYDQTVLGNANPAYFNSDVLHMNGAGQQVAASAWAPVLNIKVNPNLPTNTIYGVDASNFFASISPVKSSLVLRDTSGNVWGNSGIFNKAIGTDGTQGLVIQAFTGGSGLGAIYSSRVPGNNGNYILLGGNGTSGNDDTFLNAAVTDHIRIGGSDMLQVTAGAITAIPLATGGAPQMVTANSSGQLGIQTIPVGGVSSVSNSDGTLTITPTTGAVVASLNTAHINNWSVPQMFNNTLTVSGANGLIYNAVSGGGSNTIVGPNSSSSNIFTYLPSTEPASNGAVLVGSTSGITSWTNTPSFASGATGVTQSANDQSTKLATDQFVWYNAGNIVMSTDITSVTASVAIGTYTVGASNGSFRAGGYTTINSILTDVAAFYVTYTDIHSNSQTKYFFLQGATDYHLSTTGDYEFPTMDFRAKAGTNITMGVTLTTGTGSINYDAGITLQQLAR